MSTDSCGRGDTAATGTSVRARVVCHLGCVCGVVVQHDFGFGCAGWRGWRVCGGCHAVVVLFIPHFKCRARRVRLCVHEVSASSRCCSELCRGCERSLLSPCAYSHHKTYQQHHIHASSIITTNTTVSVLSLTFLGQDTAIASPNHSPKWSLHCEACA